MHRWVFVVAFLAVLLVPAPASAHGGATVTIHSDGRGSVWMTGSWQDGHPLSDPMKVSLTATNGTDRIGPAELHATGDAVATQLYDGTLPTGTWRTVLTLGAPVASRCQAQIPVAAATETPLPLEVACLLGTAAAPVAAPSAPTSFSAWLFAVPVLILAAAAVVYAITRPRPRRAP